MRITWSYCALWITSKMNSYKSFELSWERDFLSQHPHLHLPHSSKHTSTTSIGKDFSTTPSLHRIPNIENTLQKEPFATHFSKLTKYTLTKSVSKLRSPRSFYFLWTATRSKHVRWSFHRVRHCARSGLVIYTPSWRQAKKRQGWERITTET